MHLTSTAFVDGAIIPRKFTCDGEDLSPPLRWSGAPAQTQSFVLLCDDPDAPGGTFRHWAVYDIPAAQNELTEGAGNQDGAGDFRQGVTDFRRSGYGGPCPPHGHGMHHYHFRLLAIDRPTLGLHARPTFEEVEKAAQDCALAEAKLTGIYKR